MSVIISRRKAICGVLVALLAPGAVVACSSDAGTEAPPDSDGNSGGGTGGALAALTDVPVGGGVVVDGPDGPVLLVQETEGTVTGYDASCPHAGTTVNPPADGVVVCPNHGSRFDPATGDVQNGPAQQGLAAVAVTVSGADVILA